MGIPKPAAVVGDEAALVAQTIGSQQRVLDCGCGGGKVARLLIDRGCEVVGVELNPERATTAESVCQRIVRGSLSDPETWAQVGAIPLDVVLFSHVIEHLTDAAPVLRRAVHQLRPNGRVVAVVPNVAHWRIRLQLLTGSWRYEDSGILDRTHVHFYTLKSAAELFESVGLNIITLQVPLLPPGGGTLRRWMVSSLRHVFPVGLLAVSFIFEMQRRAQA